MCLGIPGKVVATYREHEVLMAKVDFSGVAKRKAEPIPSPVEVLSCGWSRLRYSLLCLLPPAIVIWPIKKGTCWGPDSAAHLRTGGLILQTQVN